MNSFPVTSTVSELQRLIDIYPPMDHRTQEALAIVATKGSPEEREKAIDLLFKHNAGRILYFVRLYAKDVPQEKTGKLQRDHRYMLRWKEHAPWTLTSDEIISAALTGFWKAVKTFNPERGRFNQHANVAIWREIQRTRQKEEKRGSHVTESLDAIESECPYGGEPSLDDEKEVARIMFARYLERICPEHAEAVFAMLDGNAPEDHELLHKVGALLREHIPEDELAWLEDRLAWGD